MRPRIRTIKPETWADEKVGHLSHGSRLLFLGLITMADDEGRVRELPAAIIGHVFPYDDVSFAKVTRWLAEIAATGIVVRYAVGDCRYVAFRKWSKHQKVDRGNNSELPPPPTGDSTKEQRKDHEASTIVRRTFDDGSRPTCASAQCSDPDPDPIVDPEEDSPRALFDYWRTRCGHESALPTRERLAKLKARRDEGYTGAQIRQAIDGAARAAFVNDAGKKFDDIELICRNGSKVELFMDRATVTPRSAVSDLDQRRLAAARRAIQNGGGAA